tara:strand:- start:4251 stop:5681 length:1431 start_codon:yes stop_codon:yes gene_type:complete
MANVYSIGQTDATMQSSSIDNSRRMFNFGEKVAELAPKQSPFFTYLSKVAKKPTDDPVFKFLEQRHQWQRRNFEVKTAMTTSAHAGSDANSNLTNLQVDCLYDKYGRVVTIATLPNFILEGQVVVIECEYDINGTDAGVGSETAAKAYYKINATPDVSNAAYAEIDGTFIKVVYKPTASVSGEITEHASSKLIFRADAKAQIVGSAFAEGTTDPEGWKDEFYDREGYTQIFKTAISLFSGTSLATRYRGVSNEYKRVWQEKLMEHKMDLEHAMMFGIGSDDSTSTGPLRRTWGIVPYTEAYGKIKNFTYASSSYDDFIDAMEDVFSPESGNSGNKLVLASRKVLSYFNKLGGESFLGNTMALGHTATSSGGSNGYGMDIQNVKGSFGHNVTKVNTLYGDLHLVEQPLFRGMWDDYAIMIDLKNVAYRPLAANGQSRDTSITTNVQANNVDGRKDQILTEAGLEISLPETHTLLKFA